MSPAWRFFCRHPIADASQAAQLGSGTKFGPHPAPKGDDRP